MSAASRAVTVAARDRRLHLVNLYLDRLKELNAPSPFDEDQLTAVKDGSAPRSAFVWAEVHAEHA